MATSTTTTPSSSIPIFKGNYGLTPQSSSKRTTEIIIIVIAVVLLIVLGGAILGFTYFVSKDRKELFIVTFLNPEDNIKPDPSDPTKPTTSKQAGPFIEEIKKKFDVEGLASLSEAEHASASGASWCERCLIDTDFTDVYYIYNKFTASLADQQCTGAESGKLSKQAIASYSDGVQGFTVYGKKPDIKSDKLTLNGKNFVIKPWNGKKWSYYS